MHLLLIRFVMDVSHVGTQPSLSARLKPAGTQKPNSDQSPGTELGDEPGMNPKNTRPSGAPLTGAMSRKE